MLPPPVPVAPPVAPDVPPLMPPEEDEPPQPATRLTRIAASDRRSETCVRLGNVMADLRGENGKG